MSQRVEYSVEQGTKGAVGPAVIDGGAEDESVDAVLDHSPHFVVQVIIKRAFAQSPAHTTCDAALYGMFADAYDFCVDALLVQRLGHFTECQVGVPILFGAAVD